MSKWVFVAVCFPKVELSLQNLELFSAYGAFDFYSVIVKQFRVDSTEACLNGSNGVQIAKIEKLPNVCGVVRYSLRWVMV